MNNGKVVHLGGLPVAYAHLWRQHSWLASFYFISFHLASLFMLTLLKSLLIAAPPVLTSSHAVRIDVVSYCSSSFHHHSIPDVSPRAVVPDALPSSRDDFISFSFHLHVVPQLCLQMR